MKRTWQQVVASAYVSDEEMDRFGLERLDLTVVRILDDRADKPWFYRAHQELGVINTLCADGVPVRKDEMFAFVHANFGTDCSVLW